MIKKNKLFSLGLILTLSIQSTSTFAFTNTNQDISSSESLVFENNNKPLSGWQYINEHWYYFKSDGSLAKGWLDINGYWYYLDSNTGEMKTGLQEINGYKYYLDESGYMRTGWVKYDGDYYFFGSDGTMKTGWINDGYAYYFLNRDGTIYTGWLNENGEKYYLGSNGDMKLGWQYIDNQWYYFRPDGNMRIGWEKINDYWYYFNSDGVMLKDITQSIDGQDYRFNSDGEMLSDIWDGATYINPNGIVLAPTPSMSNSYTQYKLFNYMSSEKHREDVHNTSIKLHGGITSNNCVYFASEALRRVGVNIPLYTANTYQLERELLSKGWKKSTDLRKLKPGDIVFSGSAHAFIFMHWYDSDSAYIVDNQKKVFGEVLHKRKITSYDSTYDTYKSTHFYYLPN
ncbi:cell wall-binding protein [Clostridium perfringens]|uniref:cell wall-binding protein n=1 Tax=Clostridium perfringens TaxID=1502 RepID=UPI00224599C2|nr:cell wall-binding protein [Clostridium perfringens]MCX0367681.1 cell wall-binding protein [Clostridium perfringens]